MKCHSSSGSVEVVADSLTVDAGLLEKGAINLAASSVAAGEGPRMVTADSVDILSAQENLSDTASTRSSSNLFNSETTQQAGYAASSRPIGSVLSGGTVDIALARTSPFSGAPLLAMAQPIG